MRRCFIIFLALLLLYSFSVFAYATSEENDQILDDVVLSIHEECSGHPYFLQYLVREDGLFAVYYRTSDHSSVNSGIYTSAYVDIFNAEGEFIREIELVTRDAIVLNFSENILEIYLAEWLLSVDLDTWQVVPVKTTRYYAQENGLLSKFNQKKQTANGWQYSTKGRSMNYTSLVRESGETTEVLLSLSGNIPGTNQSRFSFAMGGIAGGALILFLWSWFKKKNK